MTSFTYATLKQSIYDFTEDSSDEVVGSIDVIIGNGMEMLIRDLDLDIFNKTTQGTFSAGSENLNKPSDYILTKSLRYTDTSDSSKRKGLLLRSADFCEEYNLVSTSTGRPKYFADERETNLIISPPPNNSYAYSWRYLARPAALSDSNTSNWISTNLGDLLLYSCLVQAESFLKTEKQSGKWMDKYIDQVSKAKAEMNDIMRKDYKPFDSAAKVAPNEGDA